MIKRYAKGAIMFQSATEKTRCRRFFSVLLAIQSTMRCREKVFGPSIVKGYAKETKVFQSAIEKTRCRTSNSVFLAVQSTMRCRKYVFSPSMVKDHVHLLVQSTTR